MGVGRPTSYKSEFAEQAYKLCLLGAKDEDIAAFFRVKKATLNKWKKEHPEFIDSLKRGRDEADTAIAQSLYHRAKGYSHPAVKIIQHEGKVIEVPYTEYYPPDTTACIFWLKNRHPKWWRDKTEQEISGPDGGPVGVVILPAADLDLPSSGEGSE